MMTSRSKRWFAGCLFVVYGVVLIRFIVFKDIPTIHIGHMRFRFGGTHTGPANFTPLRTLGPMLRGSPNHVMAAVNIAGNIFPFMPVGFLAPCVLPEMRWKSSFLLAVLTGLSMEVMEVVFQVGIFDVDDILLNAIGVMLGYWVFTLFRGSRSA